MKGLLLTIENFRSYEYVTIIDDGLQMLTSTHPYGYLRGLVTLTSVAERLHGLAVAQSPLRSDRGRNPTSRRRGCFSSFKFQRKAI